MLPLHRGSQMSKRLLMVVAVCAGLVAASFSQGIADSDENLASDFWAWRARSGQYTSDDVPRM